MKKIKTNIDNSLSFFTNEGVSSVAKRHLTLSPILRELFIGRQKEIQAIHKTLTKTNTKSKIVFITGNGGIGKTSIASEYYHRNGSEYNHQGWISANNGILEGFTILKRTLQIDFRQESTDEKFVIISKALNQLQGLKLIVIDNADNINDITTNLSKLKTLKKTHILITSRVTFTQEDFTVSIQELDFGSQLKLFKSHYQKLKPDEEQAVNSLSQMIEGNTLILDLMARKLGKANQFKNSLSVKNLLENLRQKGLLYSRNSQKVSTDYQQFNYARPEEIISKMYDIEALQDSEQKLLKCLSLLPSESIPYSYIKLMFEHIKNFELGLNSLSEKGWIEHDQVSGCFKCNPVIQEVVRSKSKDLFVSSQELIENLSTMLSHEYVHLDNYYHAEHFSRYAESLLTKLQELSRSIGELWQNIGNYYQLTGDLNKSKLSFESMQRQFENALLKHNDSNTKNGLAIAYSKLGETHSALGNLDQALRFFESDIKLSQQLFNEYPNDLSFKNGLAISFSKLGETHSALGNLDEALRFFKKQSKLSEELYKDYPNNVSFKNGLAIAYEKLGSIHSTLGNLDQALKFFNHETILFKQLFQDYPDNVSLKNGLAIAYAKLGSTHSALGNLEQALRFFDDETELFEQLFKDYPNNVSFKNGLAISYSKLGSTHSALGNLEQALRFFEKDIDLSKELFKDHPNNVSFKNGLAISYSKLGETHSALGNLEQALTFFEQRSELGEQLFKDYPNNVSFKNGLAISYVKLGQIKSQKNDLAAACARFQQAKMLWKELVVQSPQHAQFRQFLESISQMIKELGCEEPGTEN